MDKLLLHLLNDFYFCSVHFRRLEQPCYTHSEEDLNPSSPPPHKPAWKRILDINIDTLVKNFISLCECKNSHEWKRIIANFRDMVRK